VHLINVFADEAATLIAAITAHIPQGTSLGRVRVASRLGLLADYGNSAAMYGYESDEGCAWRQIEVSGDLREIVTWRDGSEVGRKLLRALPADG
jgi:hypothetical protein